MSNKLSISFKCPDVVDRAVKNFVDNISPDMPTEEGDEYWREDKANEIKEQISRWIKWGEYITVEFDLDNGTASVKEA